MPQARPFEVMPGVYALGSTRVNWYLVKEGDDLTAVDAGLPGFGKRLDADLAALDLDPASIRALVLTHSDADHTGLAPRLRDAGARVLVHAQDEDTLRRPRSKDGDASPIHIVPRLASPTLLSMIVHMAREGGARPQKVEGAETFSDGEVLDVPGKPRAIHTPGHTAGHCVLAFEGVGALFVGDALCTWNPISGRSGAQLMPAPFNVDNDQCLASLAAFEDRPEQVLLPGHGEPFRDGAAAAVARVRELGRT